jgi:hypothetical protein
VRQQDGLVVRGLRDAASADLHPLTRWQHDVNQLDLAQLLEDPPWLSLPEAVSLLSVFDIVLK